jgi:PPM family protein phosphatase
MLAEPKIVERRGGPISMTEISIDCGERSDVGRVRENNEDNVRTAPELGLFVLSDGMGGQASGEVASRLATESIVAYCREASANPSLPLEGERIAGLADESNRLASAIRRVNREIREAWQKDLEWRGMGATVVAAWVAGDRISLAHVGDSRAYRLRAGQLEQVTQDHSLVAEQVRRGILTSDEAKQSNLQNVLMRALGAEEQVEVDVEEELFLEGDALLLCSDGLTREVSDAQIANVLKKAQNAQAAADQLVDLANQAGGEDNVSVIVLRRGGRPAKPFGRLGRWFKR